MKTCLRTYREIRLNDDLLLVAVRRCVKETIRSSAFRTGPLGRAYTHERGASTHLHTRSLAVIQVDIRIVRIVATTCNVRVPRKAKYSAAR